MAQNQQVLAIGRDWTQITNASVTHILFQVLRGTAYIAYTVGTTAPTAEQGILYTSPKGENDLLSVLISLVGADRVWAKAATNETTTILVDHA